MKEIKRREIIESAIQLFAENGFYNTSVQEIVNDCEMSKGAFYNYFLSKEELHIAIFQYYFEEMNNRFKEIASKNTDPREKMKLQLGVLFDQVNHHKEFFMMYLREQSFSINKELREFMEKTQHETLNWYVRSLKEIYGDKITPYTGDIIIAMEGINKSYLAAMLFHNVEIDVQKLLNFIMNRIDDIVNAFEKGEEPIVKSQLFGAFPQDSFEDIDANKKVTALLADIEEQLDIMDIEDDQKNGLHHVLHFLKEELKKPAIEKYTFQGMLANLKEIKEFDRYREKIAGLLDIQLL